MDASQSLPEQPPVGKKPERQILTGSEIRSRLPSQPRKVDLSNKNATAGHSTMAGLALTPPNIVFSLLNVEKSEVKTSPLEVSCP